MCMRCTDLLVCLYFTDLFINPSILLAFKYATSHWPPVAGHLATITDDYSQVPFSFCLLQQLPIQMGTVLSVSNLDVIHKPRPPKGYTLQMKQSTKLYKRHLARSFVDFIFAFYRCCYCPYKPQIFRHEIIYSWLHSQ